MESPVWHPIRELSSTEQTYLEALRSFQSLFLCRLPSSVIGQTKALSMNIDWILATHSRCDAFRPEQLNYRSPTSTVATIEQICNGLMQLDLVPCYTQYVTNFDHYQTLLNSIMSGKSRQDLLVLEKSLPLQSVSSYLIMPIQRPPRYILLLKALIAGLESESFAGTLELAQRTLHQITVMVASLNKAKRDSEVTAMLQKLADSQSKFDPFKESRRLLRYGRVQTLHHGTSDLISKYILKPEDGQPAKRSKPEQMNCFLFTDSIILLTEQLSFRQQLDLHEAVKDTVLMREDALLPTSHYFGIRWQRIRPETKLTSPLNGFRKRTSTFNSNASMEHVEFYFEHQSDRESWLETILDSFNVELKDSIEADESDSYETESTSASKHSADVVEEEKPISSDPGHVMIDSSTVEDGVTMPKTGKEHVAMSSSNVAMSSTSAVDQKQTTDFTKFFVDYRSQTSTVEVITSDVVRYTHWTANAVVPIQSEIDEMEMRQVLRQFEDWVCADDREFDVIVFNAIVKFTGASTDMSISVVVILHPQRHQHASQQLCEQFNALIGCRAGFLPHYLILVANRDPESHNDENGTRLM